MYLMYYDDEEGNRVYTLQVKRKLRTQQVDFHRSVLLTSASFVAESSS